jgi:hypothetical protein
MPIGIITLAIQAIAIIHVLRTGRDFRWIFLLVFLPGLGALIYFAIEVLPSLRSNPAARKTMRNMGKIVDPSRQLRSQQLAYDRSQNVETATRLANELIRDGKYDEAIKLCNEARTGVFEDDPTILLALATAHFERKAYRDCIAALDQLREKNPSFRSPEGHLLYARALEEDGQTDRAIEEFESVASYFPGAEARVRFAQLHERLGNRELALQMFRQIVDDARIAPRHFQKAQRQWIDIAKKAVN